MEWIDINEDKPKELEPCFITGVYKSGIRFYGTDVYLAGKWCDTSFNELMTVTHFMHYEPPKIDQLVDA